MWVSLSFQNVWSRGNEIQGSLHSGFASGRDDRLWRHPKVEMRAFGAIPGWVYPQGRNRRSSAGMTTRKAGAAAGYRHGGFALIPERVGVEGTKYRGLSAPASPPVEMTDFWRHTGVEMTGFGAIPGWVYPQGRNRRSPSGMTTRKAGAAAGYSHVGFALTRSAVSNAISYQDVSSGPDDVQCRCAAEEWLHGAPGPSCRGSR